ncbi:MAG: type III pantothenate kinase [Planctomycetaceae bacterium]
MLSTTSHRPSQWLLVDAGNTRTKLGLFDAVPPVTGKLPVCTRVWILENSEPPDWALLQSAATAFTELRLCLAGSNPRRVEELLRLLPDHWPQPVLLPERSAFPLRMRVDFPEKVGIDRLLNAIAANQLRRAGQAAVVVSSGTATTVDYVAPDGSFCGGAILPGFELSARALHEYTALLPLIPLDVVLQEPPDELGRNTEAALRSGLYWGHVGAVRELVRRFMHRATSDQQTSDQQKSGLQSPAQQTAARQSGGDVRGRHLGNITAAERPLVLLTGGAAPLLQSHLPSLVHSEPQLALQGLALLCGTMDDSGNPAATSR